MNLGKVTRPDFDSGDSDVMLTATVSKGLVTKKISFPVIVKKLGITDGQAVIRDAAEIVLPAETKVDLVLPSTGQYGSTITWATNNDANITDKGKVTRPDVDALDVTVKLTATVKKGSDTEIQEFNVKVLAWTTIDEITDAAKMLVFDKIAGTNASINMVTSDLVLPATIGRSVNVAWTTSSPEFCDIGQSGKITRPTFTQGPVIISLTATITKKGETQSVVIAGIRLEPAAITNQEVAIDAINKLDSSMFIGTNTALTAITDSMILPITIDNQLSTYNKFTWELVDADDHTAVTSIVKLNNRTQDVECVITRPSSTEGNYAVFLKATATCNDPAGSPGTSTKSFYIVVQAKP